MLKTIHLSTVDKRLPVNTILTSEGGALLNNLIGWVVVTRNVFTFSSLFCLMLANI